MAVAVDSLEGISLPNEFTRIYVKIDRRMLRYFDRGMERTFETDSSCHVLCASRKAFRNAHQLATTRLFGPPDRNDSTWRGERTWRKVPTPPGVGRADKHWYGFSYVHNFDAFELGEEQPLVLELTVDKAEGGKAVFRVEWLEGEALQASNDATNAEISEYWATRD
jgi:hypothetical protein